VHAAAIGRQERARLLVKAVDDPASLTREEIQVLKDLYDAGLMYVDQNIGALLDVLKHIGALNNTVVVLTADHGEEFLEHNGFGHGANIHILDQEGKARIKLYDELLHVPLIAKVPDLDTPPQEIPALVSLVDIGPTLVDLLGKGKVDRWQGRSLTPLLCGKTERIRDGVFSGYVVRNGTTNWPVVSYRTQKWKYIHDGTSRRDELYDLTEDPAEVCNMYGPDVSGMSMLQQKVREHLTLAPSDTMTMTEPDVDPEVIERLRGLGYIE
jgi:arylsulfatase A-like enzyme